MKKLNIIFDIDSCMAFALRFHEKETHSLAEKNLGKELSNDLLHTAYEYEHYIFPGFYELWLWLHKKGITIKVFSTGIKERNVELIDKISERTFRHIKKEDRPVVEVFSREDTFDTEKDRDEDDRYKYQSCWFGNLKKQLEDVVVTKEELPYSLLIDDDRSYVFLNEEKNLLYVSSSFSYYPESEHIDERDFQAFHKAYYVCGVLDKIINYAKEKKITLIDAAEYIQATKEGKEIKKDFFFPSLDRMEYYTEGLKILQTIEPSLKFYFQLAHKDKMIYERTE